MPFAWLLFVVLAVVAGVAGGGWVGVDVAAPLLAGWCC